MNANRRLRERKQPERIVVFKLGGEESGSVLNLSEDGMCFESFTPIEEKNLLHLRLSVDLNRAIEAGGQLAWIDSAKRKGGLRFLELGAPAREQIRAWLGETSAASSLRDSRAFLEKPHEQADDRSATEKLMIWQEMPVRSIQLVPKKRYRAQMRWQLVRGVLLGLGIGTVVMIPIFRHAVGTKPGSPARTTVSANRAAESSAKQTEASVGQPRSGRASISEPTASASQAAVAPRRAASNPHSSSGQVQHPKKRSATPQQLWSAVEAGSTKAAVALADLYTRGEGVPVNCEQARILLLAAAEKNNAEASKKLQELDQGGCPANSE